MTQYRKRLATQAVVYLFGEDTAHQRKLAERWIILHDVKVLDWYEDRIRRRNLHRLLERLDSSNFEIDYVLTESRKSFGKQAMEIQTRCEAYGARVIYTSREQI